MTVEIHGNLSANTLILSEKFRRYSTGLIVFGGVGATVEIDGPVTSGDVYVTAGSGSEIRIGADCVIGMLSVHAAVEGSRIVIGREVGFAGAVSIAAHERAEIAIGAGCLIADDAFISASDIHPVFDVATGVRINPAADIRIGDRVWLGARAIVMKGGEHRPRFGGGRRLDRHQRLRAQQPDRRQPGAADPLGRALEPLTSAAEPSGRGEGSSGQRQPRRSPCPSAPPSPRPSGSPSSS